MRAHHRHVAGVIMRALVLLVGLVVLLIDHDQPEIGVGQKQRRARAHHHLRVARRDRGPVAGAGARRQLGMPFQRPHPESRGKTIEELPGQRDLRHQDQRLFAAPDDFGDRLEIDFGLARAGDAVEQRHRIAALIDRGAQRIGGGELAEREFGLAEIRIGRRVTGSGGQHHGFQRALRRSAR